MISNACISSLWNSSKRRAVYLLRYTIIVVATPRTYTISSLTTTYTELAVACNLAVVDLLAKLLQCVARQQRDNTFNNFIQSDSRALRRRTFSKQFCRYVGFFSLYFFYSYIGCDFISLVHFTLLFKLQIQPKDDDYRIEGKNYLLLILYKFKENVSLNGAEF